MYKRAFENKYQLPFRNTEDELYNYDTASYKASRKPFWSGGVIGAALGAPIGATAFQLSSHNGLPTRGNIIVGGLVGLGLGAAAGSGTSLILNRLRYNKQRTGKYLPSRADKQLAEQRIQKEYAERVKARRQLMEKLLNNEKVRL